MASKLKLLSKNQYILESIEGDAQINLSENKVQEHKLYTGTSLCIRTPFKMYFSNLPVKLKFIDYTN